jgi:adenosylhomocysteine nucleosidase
MKTVLFVALESELPKELIPAELDIDIHYTGVGKVNSAIVATKVLSDYDPNETIVINYGSAGGPKKYRNKLYRCDKFRQGDIDCRPLSELGQTPFETILWNTECIDFDYEKIENGFECITADQFITNPTGIHDMEAYSIAKVCKLRQFDFVSYKWISDSGDHNDWDVNHSKGISKFIKILNMALYKKLKEINQQILYWENRQPSGNMGKWYNSIRIEVLNKKKTSILKKLKK